MRSRWSALGSSARNTAGRGAAGRGSPRRWRSWRLLLAPALGLVVIGQLGLASTTGAAATVTTAAAAGSVAPNPVNELDCNGWSAKYQAVRQLAGDLCTDIGGSSFLCDVSTGAGCTVPPISANFYPFWSLSPSSSGLGSQGTGCVWNFGNVLPQTIEDFGGDAQYGAPDLSWCGGTSISAPMANPQFSGRCAT